MISKMVPSFLAAVLVGMFATPTLAQDNGALERRGNTLLTRNCSRCHAIGTIGNSPHVQAPAFRTLGRRYPIEMLAEALAEGFSTGHPDMPEFIFASNDVKAILAYLESIQEPANR